MKAYKRNILIIAALIIHLMTYCGTRLFTRKFYHYNLTTSIDDKIPLIPCMICIYFGCYIFWAINYYMGCTQEEDKAICFICSEILAKILCCICYVFFPTTNVRPLIGDVDAFNRMLLWLYRIDAPDNLFPSIHCLTSWLSVIAVRDQKRIPQWYKNISVVMVILVCISTLTLKQHVIVDVISGVLLGELSYRLVCLIKPYILQTSFSRII